MPSHLPVSDGAYVVHENVSCDALEVEEDAVRDERTEQRQVRRLLNARQVHEEERRRDLNHDGRDARVELKLGRPATRPFTVVLRAGMSHTFTNGNITPLLVTLELLVISEKIMHCFCHVQTENHSHKLGLAQVSTGMYCTVDLYRGDHISQNQNAVDANAGKINDGLHFYLQTIKSLLNI